MCVSGSSSLSEVSLLAPFILGHFSDLCNMIWNLSSQMCFCIYVTALLPYGMNCPSAFLPHAIVLFMEFSHLLHYNLKHTSIHPISKQFKHLHCKLFMLYIKISSVNAILYLQLPKLYHVLPRGLGQHLCFLFIPEGNMVSRMNIY